MSRNCLYLFVFIVVPICWTIGLFPRIRYYNASKKTSEILVKTERVIKDFIDDFNESPKSMSELKAYAKLKRFPLSPIDAYGGRLEYFRLDSGNYLVRSFGADGVQNSAANEADLAIISEKRKKEEYSGLVYEYATVDNFNFYPAALLLGALSPNRLWVARLYSDSASGTRKLLVRHLTGNDFFMVANHDEVEEFLWLPDGYRIIFTATSSARYRDGIYLWNLLDDSLINLFDLNTTDVRLLNFTGQGRVYLSLAGIEAGGPTVFVYAMDQSAFEIDPEAFFAKSSLFSVKIPRSGGSYKFNWVKGIPADFTPFLRFLRLGEFVDKTLHGTAIQRKWLRLPLQGNLENVLTSWQGFLEKFSNTPLFSYGLWYLSVLYYEAYRIMEEHPSSNNDKNAPQILRSYATELSRALSRMPLAPSYLRGVANFTNRNLMANEPLPFNVSRLTLGEK